MVAIIMSLPYATAALDHKALQTSYTKAEKIVTAELAVNQNLTSNLTNKVTAWLSSFCTGWDYSRIYSVRNLVGKLGQATVESLNEFFKVISENIPTLQAVQPTVNKALNNLKDMLETKGNKGPAYNSYTTSYDAKAQALFKRALPEIVAMGNYLQSCVNKVSNRCTEGISKLVNTIEDYDNQFETIFKNTMPQYLSEGDLVTLTKFLESPTFTSCKAKLPKLMESVVSSVSTDTKAKIEALVPQLLGQMFDSIDKLLS